MTAFLAGPEGKAAEEVARAGLTVLESSVLGAITILAVGITIWSVMKLSKVQDKRVEDLGKMNERMEGLITKLTSTFADVSNSLNNLTQSEKEGRELLQTLKASIDGVIRDAINRLGNRTYSPPGGTPRQLPDQGGRR